jgi:membrane protein required for colicin V production
MLIDIIVFLLLALAIFKGYSKGLVVAVFSFLAFVIGLAAALKLSAIVAEYLGHSTSISQRWLPVLAFAFVFIAVVLLVRLGAKAIEGALKIAMLGWANRLGGIFFYALLYLFIFSLILFYSEKLHLIRPETTQASITYTVIHPIGPKVISGLAVVLPFFKNMFNELGSFFDNISKKAA